MDYIKGFVREQVQVQVNKFKFELINVHDATVELVADQIVLERWLLGDSTPGLIIDGNLIWAGSTPSFEQVERWLRERLDAYT